MAIFPPHLLGLGKNNRMLNSATFSMYGMMDGINLWNPIFRGFGVLDV